MKTDKYRSFSELSQHENEGKDYRIEFRDRGSRILIMAIHGGKIERGSDEIAYRIAGQDFSFYAFLGVKTRGNKDLHIASLNFDEPRCRTAVNSAGIAVSIHGHNDTQSEFVMLGGLHEEIIQVLKTELENAGYEVRFPVAGRAGVSANNICNLGRSGKGLQIEISRKLRDRFEAQPAFARVFADKVRGVLLRSIVPAQD